MEQKTELLLQEEIIMMPLNSVLAGMFGFDTATYFEASESSKDVPNVSFE